jgi:hypothetical protein
MQTWTLIVLLPLFSAAPDKGEYRAIWEFPTEQQCQERRIWAQKEFITQGAPGRMMCISSYDFPVKW